MDSPLPFGVVLAPQSAVPPPYQLHLAAMVRRIRDDDYPRYEKIARKTSSGARN
jgi:hypothetical protein